MYTIAFSPRKQIGLFPKKLTGEYVYSIILDGDSIVVSILIRLDWN